MLATPGRPSTLLYGVYNGALLQSGDLGRTWTPIYVTEPGLPQPPVLGFAIDELNHDILYLATTQAAGTFWRSDNRGTTWTRAAAGLPSGGPSLDFFKQIRDGAVIHLDLKIGAVLYKSTNRAQLWNHQGDLPGADAVIDFAPLVRARGYFVDRSTLQAYNTIDEGHSWNAVGKLIEGTVQDLKANAVGIAHANSERAYFSVTGLAAGTGSYQTSDAGLTFMDNNASGLGPFTKLFSGVVGPLYAPAAGLPGFYRSQDDGLSWTLVGGNPVNSYSLYAVDPVDRAILHGLRGGNLNALVRSENAGETWEQIDARLTPTLAKPVPGVNVTVLEGGPYQHAFTVRTLENESWTTPVTLSTSGEPWLELLASSGMTPLASGVRINSAGLAPGTYQATVTINGPQTFNKSVSFAVTLTVRAFGSVERRHVISTAAGNGLAGGTRLEGPALELGIGAPRSVAIGPDGRLWVSAGNRLWRLDAGRLGALAGNGMMGSSGDGLDPLEASISDPSAIAFDQQARPYFSEFVPRRVRRIDNNTINTRVNFNTFNFLTGSHGLLVDAFGQLILAAPEGILRYDGFALRVATPFAFRDPYGLAGDAAGNLYVSDRILHRIFRVTPQGAVTVFAGRGDSGFGGDGGPATQAHFNAPSGLAFGPDGTLYVADTGNQRVRAIGPDGVIRTIAGSGLTGFAGDGGIADFASFRNPVALAAGPDGRVFVADSDNNRVRVLELRDVEPPPPPPPAPQAVGRGGSEGTLLSPGGLFSLYGARLAKATAQAASIPWPLELNGVRITVNGTPAPLYYVSPTQINGQIPYEVVAGTAALQITVDGASATISFPVAAASPGILIYGNNRAVAVNPNGAVNGPGTPARAGDVVVVYLSGIGVPNPAVATGAAAPSNPLAAVNHTYSITVGGQPAEGLYLGQTPGYPSLAQGNFRVPNLAPGDYLIVVTVNGVASNSVLLTVGP